LERDYGKMLAAESYLFVTSTVRQNVRRECTSFLRRGGGALVHKTRGSKIPTWLYCIFSL
jgi:hypothetical protein